MDISQSLDTILDSQDVFGDTFYEVFLNRFPEVQQFFEDVDIKRQGILLTMALTTIEQYYRHPYPATKRYLQYLGTAHCNRAIPREMFDKWTVAMLATLEQLHGSDWSPSLRDQWHRAIQRATEVMFDGYQNDLYA